MIAAGLIIYAGALTWCVCTLSPTSDYFVAILPTLLVGSIGTGLVFVAATAVGVHGVAPQQSGSAAGLLNAGTQVGASVGLSALAAIAAIVTRSHLAGHTTPTALTDGYAAGLLAGRRSSRSVPWSRCSLSTSGSVPTTFPVTRQRCPKGAGVIQAGTISLADQLELERVVWTMGRCLDERDLEGLRHLFTADATVITGETANGHNALVEQARRRHSTMPVCSTSSPT